MSEKDHCAWGWEWGRLLPAGPRLINSHGKESQEAHSEKSYMKNSMAGRRSAY